MGGGTYVPVAGGNVGGSVPAIVPGAAAGAPAFGLRVKAVVVSAFVPVSGGMVSPGP
jgi:hypothetical protein